MAGAAVAAVLPMQHASARTVHTLRRDEAGHQSYASFLDDIRMQATRLGISGAVLDVALALERPNARVLELDRHQPEFTLTWSQYRQRVLTDSKIRAARTAYQSRLSLLTGIWQRYRVDPRVVVGIWGLESNYGSRTGSFEVVDALATLAFNGRRAAFFRAELMDALQILQRHDIEAGRMLGSYAGAMGQPQFMPSSYGRYAVDYDGDGRRDIWSSEADVLASISNYLSRNGWVGGAPWGQQVSIRQNAAHAVSGLQTDAYAVFGLQNAARAGSHRQVRRSLGEWMRLGVRRMDGAAFSRSDVPGILLLPDGAAGDAFMVYDNFDVIRRYNPSDFYGLAVGLLGSAAA